MNESHKRRSNKKPIFYTLLLVVAGVGVTIGLSSCGNNDPNIRVDQKKLPRDPPLATENLPELYLAENKRSFGVFAVGMQKQVEFKVENKGVGPLIIKKYRDSCNCIDIEFVPKEIPPGESGILRAIYKPTTPRPAGVHHLIFRTNDPKNENFELQIKSSVVAPFEFFPKTLWDFGEIDYQKADQKTSIRGFVISRYLDFFEIESMDCYSKRISVRKEPINEEMKKKYSAKSGYAIDVKLEEHLPIGRLYEGVTFSLRTGGYTEETLIRVRGNRFGPFVFQPIGDNADWYHVDNGMDMGTFLASEGKIVKLAVIVKDMKVPYIKISDIKTDPEFLKIKLVKVEDFPSKTRQKYELIFEVPPNKPAMTRIGKEAGIIEFKTNHPFADLMKFSVIFVSTTSK